MEENIDFENYRIEMDAKIAELTKNVETMNATISDKDKKIGELQAYIANYVSSPKKSESKDSDFMPKSFDDLYKETISEMAKNSKKV